MPKLISLEDDAKVELGQEILDQWDRCQSDRSRWLSDLAKWLYAYQGRDMEKDIPYEGASNLQVPVTATVVETIHPRIMAALYRPKPLVGFRPQEPNDFESVRAREAFLDWSLREEINIFPVLDRVILNTLLNGLQFVKTTWELKIRKLRDKHEFDLDTDEMQILEAMIKDEARYAEAIERVAGYDNGKLKDIVKERAVEFEVKKTSRKLCVYSDREEVVYDAPMVSMINPEDVAVNSDATFDLQNAEYIYHRYWMTLDQIKREVRKGIFQASKEDLEKIATLQQPDAAAEDNSREVKMQKEDITGVQVLSKTSKPDKVELIDAYFRYDVDDDGFEEEVIATICRDAPSVVLRMVRLEEVFRHGMRPFVPFYFNPVSDSIWAIGVPQILEGLQKEFNVIHNQRTDAGFIANTPFGVYVPAAGFNPEKMPIEPGFMYPVDDVNAVRWYAPPHNPAWGFQEEGGLWALVEKRMKVSDISMGRVGETQGAARTASGVQALTAQAAIGFDIYIRRFQEQFKLLVQQILALYQQYMPPDKEHRILGKEGDPTYTVTRESIRGHMDMEFTGNSLSTDRQVEREALTFLAQSVLAPNALGMLLQLRITDPQGIADWYRKLLGAFDVTGLERIIMIPEKVEMLSPEDIVSRVLQGEMPKPQMGEDHNAVIQAIGNYLNSVESLGAPPEINIALQKQMEMRQVQLRQEMVMQAVQQMLMAQQQAAAGPPPGFQPPPPGWTPPTPPIAGHPGPPKLAF